MITVAQVTEAIEAVVAEKGKDYVYPRSMASGNACSYVREGEPSCIVGKVLHRLGVPLARLIKADSEDGGFSVSASGLLDKMQHAGEINFEDHEGFIRVSSALRSAQIGQDHGRPWGEALEMYRTSL